MNKIFSIIGIIAVLFVSVQYADAVEILLEGEIKNHGIFIAIQGNDNIMMWDTLDGYSEHFDSKQKIFKSGGFSLKNPESGIAVWGHPINDDQYKLVILTNEGIVRIVGNVITNNDNNNTNTPTIRIEPKSSIGADITKWDIPTDTGRYEPVKKLVQLSTNFDTVDSIFLNEEYSPNVSVVNSQRFTEKISDASMTLQVLRDGKIMREFSGETNSMGKWNPVLRVSYPEFYPSFCYDVIITAQYGNLTSIVHDDFMVVTTVKYWESDTEYSISQQRIESDYDCNEKDARY